VPRPALLPQVADLYSSQGEHDLAVPLLQRLLDNPDFDVMDTWQQLATSYM
jgi:hypothetical protein